MTSFLRNKFAKKIEKKNQKKPSINCTSSGRSKNLNSSGFYNNIFAEIRLKTRYYTPKIGNRKFISTQTTIKLHIGKL